jgi:8-oxo-dGTP diphosphatase
MTFSYPVRDPGDAWVEGPEGRFWGRFGAAGLLVHDPLRGILLQHRVEWSHHGGTWGLPGGARNQHESAVAGALREAHEEAGVPGGLLSLRFMSVLDLGFWSYATVVTEVTEAFEPHIGDPESVELRWVAVDAVTDLPLHPGFASAWPTLRPNLRRRLVLIVDAANVVGSRPDGWWRDRRGAAERLAGRLVTLARDGILSADLDLPHERWWPEIVLVVEGQASGAELPELTEPPFSPVRILRAERDGDSAIVNEVRDIRNAHTVVVTSDRELCARVSDLGAAVHGACWLWGILDRSGQDGLM